MKEFKFQNQKAKLVASQCLLAKTSNKACKKPKKDYHNWNYNCDYNKKVKKALLYLSKLIPVITIVEVKSIIGQNAT